MTIVITMYLTVGLVDQPIDAGNGIKHDMDDGFMSFAGGSGTKNDPYQISNVTQLQNISSNLKAHYVLKTNINASETVNWDSGKGFMPIGTWSSKFIGSLNGKNHSIIGLSFNRMNDVDAGLFGYVGIDGSVKNVGLLDIDVTGSYEVGGLVGFNQGGTISNSYSTGNVTGLNDRVGGLIGKNRGAIENCGSTSNVSGYDYVGGLIGDNYFGDVNNSEASGTVIGNEYVGAFIGYNVLGDISNSHASGYVTGGQYIGGLIGYNSGRVEDCYATGMVENKTGGSYGGGLIGESFDDVIRCYSTGEVKINVESGGLIGRSSGTVEQCYATGNVSGHSVAGLVYGAFGDISNCYATGSVNGSWSGAGLVGQIVGGSGSALINNSYASGDVLGGSFAGGLCAINRATIKKCYSTGKVSGNGVTGGLVGRNDDTVADCFWDTVTSGTTSSAGGTGKTTAKMKEKGTFTGARWDLTTIWGIGEDKSYPFLRSFCTDPALPSHIADVNATEDEPFSILIDPIVQSFPGCPRNLSYNLTTDLAWLTYNISGLLSGTPSNSDVGTWLVNVTVNDIAGNSDTSSFTIDIYNTNDDPEILNDMLPNATEDQPFHVTLEALDIDPTGDDLTWGPIESNSAFLVFDNGTGNLTGMPTNDDVGDWWVNVSISDDQGGYAFMNYSITVNNTNDDPMIRTPALPDAEEDQIYRVLLEGTDVDPTMDNLTWEIVQTDASFLTIDPSTGNLTGKPTNDDVGEWWVNVSVHDGKGGSASFNFSLLVANVNDEPVITTSSLPDAIEDSLYWVILEGTDIDPIMDILTWEIVDTNAGFLEIDPTSGNLSGMPTNADVGDWWVRVSIEDGNGGLDIRELSLTVIDTNDSPSIVTVSLPDAIEDQPYSVALEGSDIDPSGDTLTWKLLVTDAGFLSIDSSTGTMSGTPGNNDVGEWWINISVEDGRGGIANSNLLLTVINVNDRPEITSDTPDEVQTDEDDEILILLAATDVDGDDLSWSDNTDLFDIDPVSGTISAIFRHEDVGSHEIEVTVDDSNGETDVWAFTLVVIEVNDPPKITSNLPPQMGLYEDELIWLYLTAEDEEDDDLTWSDDSDPFDISPSNGSIRFHPSQSEVGEWWINVTVEDSGGLTDVVSFKIVVENVNDAPVILFLFPSNGTKYRQGEVVTFGVTADDEDGDDLTATWTSEDITLGTGTSLDYDQLKTGTWVVRVSVFDGTTSTSERVEIVVVEPPPEEPGFLVGTGGLMIIAIIIAVFVCIIISQYLKRTRRENGKDET